MPGRNRYRERCIWLPVLCPTGSARPFSGRRKNTSPASLVLGCRLFSLCRTAFAAAPSPSCHQPASSRKFPLTVYLRVHPRCLGDFDMPESASAWRNTLASLETQLDGSVYESNDSTRPAMCGSTSAFAPLVCCAYRNP